MSFPITVENFEDGTLDEYDKSGTQSNGNRFEIQSSIVKNGANALLVESADETDTAGTISTSGLDRYPQRGDKLRVWMRWDSGSDAVPDRTTFSFAYTDELNTYELTIDEFGDARLSATTQTSGDTADIREIAECYIQWNADTWYGFDIEWRLNGEFDLTVIDVNEKVLDTDSGTNTDHDSGGIQFHVDGSDETGSTIAYFDDVLVTDDTTTVAAVGEKPSVSADETPQDQQATTAGQATPVSVDVRPRTGVGPLNALADGLKPVVSGKPKEAAGSSSVRSTAAKPTTGVSSSDSRGYAAVPLVNGAPVSELISEAVSFDETSLRFKTRATSGVLRGLRPETGGHSHIETADGGFVTQVRDGDGIIYTPKVSRTPLRQARSYAVTSYNERVGSQSAESYTISLGLKPLEPRDDDVTLTDTVDGTQWTFEFSSDVRIVTDRVEYDVAGESAEGTAAYTLTTHLTPVQTRALETTASHLNGIRVDAVQDGPASVRDTTEEKTNSLNITPPVENQVDVGHYVLTDWSTRWSNDAFYEVTLTVRPHTEPLADGDTETVSVVPKQATVVTS